MNKFWLSLLLTLGCTTANAQFTTDFVTGSPAPGTAFTISHAFVPTPEYTNYEFAVVSQLQPAGGSAWKYASITNIQVKDSSGNIITTVWAHAQQTTAGATVDNWWTTTNITGLSNGSVYQLVITGTGLVVGTTATIANIPFVVAFSAQ